MIVENETLRSTDMKTGEKLLTFSEAQDKAQRETKARKVEAEARKVETEARKKAEAEVEKLRAELAKLRGEK